MKFKNGEDYIINTDKVHRNSLMEQKYDIGHKDWSNDEHTKYIDIELDFQPKEGQKKIITMANDNRTKKVIVNIFRQYGKSFVCRYLSLLWMQKPGTVVGYITQTSRLAKDIFKKFVTMFPEELIKSKDGKDFIIELTNGSKLIFFSVEQTHAIRGFTLDFLIWDEVSH
ncbi:MAG: terminase family protein, partial [Clostridia bacterium]|nr:terminase family protein [Clostridia bacterium]